MPRDRIQPRTWFVEFSLKADRKPSNDESKDYIITILDSSNRGSRRIRGLQHVVCAYTSMENTLPLDSTMTPDPASSPAYIVDVIGFVHSNESILDTTMHSWIQESHVIRQHWTPVYKKPGTGNWMQQDLIRNLFDECNSGRRVRVDWLWPGDASGSIKRRGQPPHPGAEASRPLNADHFLVCSPPPSH